jgi:hypothetical protein
VDVWDAVWYIFILLVVVSRSDLNCFVDVKDEVATDQGMDLTYCSSEVWLDSLELPLTVSSWL